jgi:hypothetical protein
MDKTDAATAGCGHTSERIEDLMINERRFERSESRQPRISREEEAKNEEAKNTNATTKERDARCNEHEKKCNRQNLRR